MTHSPAVVANIVGGIGNQLFCYAAARRLALKSNARLILDVDYFRSDIYYGRQFRLDGFSLSPHSIRSSNRILPASADHYWWRVRRKVGALGLYPRQDWLVEASPYVFDQRLLTFPVNRTTVLDGYWQDERYFWDVAAVLRQELEFKFDFDAEQRATAARIRGANAVAVHCRRLHYATQANPAATGTALGMVYYRKALKAISERIANPEFFCFGDDVQWLMREWPSEVPVSFVCNSQDEMVDLWLMSQCRHFIIANSTFSWWGAWMGAAPDKIVVAPRSEGLYYRVPSPAGWIEIDRE